MLSVVADNRTREFGRSRNQIESKAASRGAYGSSATFLQIFESLELASVEGVKQMLGELKRMLDVPEIDAHQAREICYSKIDKFIGSLIELSRLQSLKVNVPESFKDILNAEIERMCEKVEFLKRRFDIGWDEAAEIFDPKL